MYTIQQSNEQAEMNLGKWTEIATTAASANRQVEWIEPGHSDYDTHRAAWNTRFDRRPALIARCHSSEGVAEAVRFATSRGLAVAIRSGGHSAAGYSTIDGGLLIDLSPMKALTIDPVRRVAVAGPGLTWGEYSTEAARYGLATPSGDTATVGVGGLTLGGGIGWLARKRGLTVDHLISAEVVTATGEIITASETEHQDLFWAIRGGGGNFGIATRFEFGLVPVGNVMAGLLLYPAEPEIVAAYARSAYEAPDGLTTIANMMQTPPMPFLSPDLYGKMHLQIGFCYVGDPQDAERAIAPLASLGPLLGRMAAPMPYPALYKFTEEASAGHPYSVRNHFLPEIDEETARLIVESAHEATSPFSIVQIRPLGGQMTRVSADATAFAHRQDPFLVAMINGWDSTSAQGDSGARHKAWTEKLWQQLKPRSLGAYIGFQGDEEESEASTRAAYSTATYMRLAAIKAKYDPDNLFSANRNITPGK